MAGKGKEMKTENKKNIKRIRNQRRQAQEWPGQFQQAKETRKEDSGFFEAWRNSLNRFMFPKD